jgi:glyoxylase-like metal-dependent hydrolase (beta-lactamase superfamily II)
MPLTAVAPELWTYVHVMRSPGAIRIPARMNIARVGSDGGLWVHSPVPIDDALAAEIAALGRVLYVVAPSAYHHMFAGKFAARFPGAKLFCAPGVARKQPGLTVAGTLADGSVPPWSEEIDQILLEGAPRMSEVVFFHRASRSLLVSDLFFNVTEPETWSTGLLLRMMGTYKRFSRSRAWKLFAKDRQALKTSVEKVIAWDFVRVLPGHGAPFETVDTRAETRAAAAWFLE